MDLPNVYFLLLLAIAFAAAGAVTLILLLLLWQENADVEWKFHSTVMWMNIMLDENVVPPPFNLLPSYESIKNLLPKYLNFKWKKRNESYSSRLSTVSCIVHDFD